MMVLVQDSKQVSIPLKIEKLVEDHYDSVFRFCSVRVGFHRAGDAAQETFLTAQRVLSKFRGDSQPRTWLIGIALNECRRVMRERQLEAVPAEFASSGGSESKLVNKEALRMALLTLSEEHREVVLLHEIDGFTCDEIATLVKVPVGTVKSRLHHAFIGLRKAMSTSERGEN
jgi:RNA polymerase sigma-70 factor, ECF subfamily